MVLFGRILAGIVAVPLLMAGIFGLTSAYFPGTELLPNLYESLQAANGALIDRGFDIPIDASVRMEEWLASPPLRFTLFPLGLVLLVVASGLGMAGKSEKVDSESEEVEDENQLDKRAAKKLHKTAAAMKKKGQIEEAAEMLWQGGELDRAAEYYLEAEIYECVADIRHDQNRFIEAAEFQLKAGNHDSAGAIFAQQEHWKEAAECYHAVGSMSVAAEMFDKAGEFTRAADCYKAVEFYRHAASAYVKVKKWKPAAECLEAVFKEDRNKCKGDAAMAVELKKLARQVGKLHLRSEQPEKAQAVLKEGECYADAAKVAISLEKYGEAAELFRDAGELEKAAEALRSLGENEAAARVLGEFHRDRGELKEAAAQMQEAGDFLEAGDIFRQLENYAEAGTCYVKQGDFRQGAEMHNLAGDRPQAGECYERAGLFTEAAECFALAGIPEKEAELLDKAGDFLRSGEVYHREGRDDDAITVLQKVQPEDETFGTASALLGDLFQARGQLSLAIKKLQQSLDGAALDRGNLPIYYTMATIHVEVGEAGTAVEIYEKILALDYHYKDVEQRLLGARQQAEAEGSMLSGLQTGTTGESVSQIPADTNASAAQAVAGGGKPGRYQVVGELGRGGMGIVYKAKDTVLDRMVAFKVLPDSFKENPQAVTNFMREAKAAAKLNHPNIVTVYDTGEQEGRYYIAMEYVDGTTLKEILRRRGRISPAGILHVLVQMSEALAYAHEQKVVHRDVKPANAMWTRDKKAKLMDFGLAKVVEEVRNHTTVVAGTPYYMSPEQTLGKNIDHRTDIYSLGATIFEMAAGVVPFKEGNIPYHHVHTPPPEILELAPDLPEPLAAIVRRCLQKDPAERFQSAREILAEVRGSLSTSRSG